MSTTVGTIFTDIWSHVTELLTRLKKVFLVFLVVMSIVSMLPVNYQALLDSTTNAVYETVVTWVINRITADLLPKGTILLPMNLFSPFISYLEVAILISLLLISPFIFYEVYAFIAPALYSNEKKYLWMMVPSFTGLFLFGASLGYFVVTPITFSVMINGYKILGLAAMYEFAGFIELAVGLVLITGLLFTFPVFFVLLVQLGLLKTEWFSKQRKIIYVILLVIIAMLTPDPSPIDTILLYVPTVLLFEISIFIGKRIENFRARDNGENEQVNPPRPSLLKKV